MNILIKNGRVINPNTNTDAILCIYAENGVICQVAEEEALDKNAIKADSIIDAMGMTVFPGLTDIHCHFRDPGWPEKETIESGCQAALAGGVTTVVCMANTNPVCDNPDTLGYILEKAEKQPIKLLQNSAVTYGLGKGDIVDYKIMLEKGACGFSDDGIAIADPTKMQAALNISQETGKVLSVHEELPQLLMSQGVNMGSVSQKVGVPGASANAETAIVARDIEMQALVGGRLHIQHVSAAGTVDLVRKAKQNGQNVTCEVTGQHLALTEEIVLKVGANGRINPPIRTQEDRRALIEGIKDGTIEMVVTDHAPHTLEEKAKGIASAPSGMIGLETSLSVTFDTLVRKEGVSRMKLAEVMSTNPAKLYDIRKTIEPGEKLDICIFDEKEKWIADKFYSKSVNTPFLGEILTGKVKYTIVGEYVFEA